MNTNYMGPKRVTEAMIGIIDPLEGMAIRVVEFFNGVYKIRKIFV